MAEYNSNNLGQHQVLQQNFPHIQRKQNCIALHAGQGEFHRFVVAPGDAEEALFWSAICMNISWKYQIPGIILSDKNIGESVFNFDMNILENLPENMSFSSWTGESTYKRYLFTETGISPLIFPPVKNETVKSKSYEH